MIMAVKRDNTYHQCHVLSESVPSALTANQGPKRQDGQNYS